MESNLEKTLADRGSTISKLESQLKEEQNKAKALDSSLETTLAAHSSTISKLESQVEEEQTKVKAFDSALETTLADHRDTTAEIESRLAEEQTNVKTLKQNLAGFRPLALVGYHIRARKLEWMKPTGQDQTVIDLGNEASHNGAIGADVALFQDLGLGKTASTVSFEAMYGVSLSSVENRFACKRLLEILDWRCGMKDFLGYSFTDSAFNKLLDPFLSSIRLATHEYRWIVYPIDRSLSDTGSEKEMYDKLEKLYDEAHGMHKITLKTR